MTTEKLTNQKIQDRVKEIKFYMKEGWSREEALEEVKGTSTLGKKAWEQIESEV